MCGQALTLQTDGQADGGRNPIAIYRTFFALLQFAPCGKNNVIIDEQEHVVCHAGKVDLLDYTVILHVTYPQVTALHYQNYANIQFSCRLR